MNILYCGDKDNAPWYIEGALRQLGHDVLHIDMNKTFPGPSNYDAVILSDYPAVNVSETEGESIIEYVNEGGRLIMCGGWESFNGFGRNYYKHPLAQILPVELNPSTKS